MKSHRNAIDELFTVPEVLSPRLAWLKKHDVRTLHTPGYKDGEKPWSAWTTEWHKKGWYVTGSTEDESLANLAKALNIPLWNEEGFKK